MSKQSFRKRLASEDYDSDGGFVEDAPKSKRSKNSDTKPPLSREMGKDDDGNQYWDISGKRRLTVSDFKGNTMVGLREFYEDKSNGKMLPGKKGISLNIDQFNAFIELLPQVEKVLKSKGVEVPRPQYDHKPTGNTEEDGKEDDEETGIAGDEKRDIQKVPSNSRSKLDRFKLKANHEATSDEED